jgi:isocitrate/isopropylmalate dehydrogenase
MFGSIAGSESLLLSFDSRFRPKTVMAEAPHGTAPSLFGKNIANPMAMILAGASLLSYIPGDAFRRVSSLITQSVFDILEEGQRTADLGGRLLTSEFTDAVIARMRAAGG